MDVPPHLQHWQFFVWERVADMAVWQNNHVAVLEAALLALAHEGSNKVTFCLDGTTFEAELVLNHLVSIDIA